MEEIEKLQIEINRLKEENGILKADLHIQSKLAELRIQTANSLVQLQLENQKLKSELDKAVHFRDLALKKYGEISSQKGVEITLTIKEMFERLQFAYDSIEKWKGIASGLMGDSQGNGSEKTPIFDEKGIYIGDIPTKDLSSDPRGY